jgi:hypothetical protein
MSGGILIGKKWGGQVSKNVDDDDNDEQVPYLKQGYSRLLVLDLSFHVVDRVARLNLESDDLCREGFHKDLHDGWDRAGCIYDPVIVVVQE